jgi:cell wall-associated NlpC family hydrolase
MRGALAASAVIAAVGLAPAPATAAPPTNNSSGSGDPMQQYQQLSRQADQLNEQINNAQADLNKKNAEVAKANGDIAKAKSAGAAAQKLEDQFRGQVDQLTAASFEGARMSQLSALLTGTSAKDFLSKAEDLQDLAADNYAVLSNFQKAVNAAQAAQSRAEQDRQTAQRAASAAKDLLNQLNTKKAQLNTQIQKVDRALHSLSAQQQHALNTDIGPQGSFIAPAGVAGRAMEIALGERGVPYKYGGATPAGFDCSGLVMWAYAQAGMGGLPHSAAGQQDMGVAVSRADLRPGDLVFFGSPAYHVGIYVGNGEMVNAPQSGEVVRVEPLFSGFSGGRRLGN